MESKLMLAIETASRVGSVAMGTLGDPDAEISFSGPMRHSAEVLPAIGSLLSGRGVLPSALHVICVSAGPGSFTGLRIAVALAKAMNLASGVKIVAVGTLDVIAANAMGRVAGPALIMPILDAKRGQFFAAAFRLTESRNTGLQKVMQDRIMTGQEILGWSAAQTATVFLLGDGLLYHQALFAKGPCRILEQDTWSPRAGQVYRLGYGKAIQGQFEDPLKLTPSYILPPEVTVKRAT